MPGRRHDAAPAPQERASAAGHIVSDGPPISVSGKQSIDRHRQGEAA